MASEGDIEAKKRLDAILANRFGGAVNIRGIRYQVLHSILLGLDLYAGDDERASLRLEGFEDADLIGARRGAEYVQAKTADTPWNWAMLKKPVRSFMEVHREEPTTHFTLAVDFPLRKDIARLANRETLPPSERRAIHQRFRSLCREIGATEREADSLIGNLRIVSLPEAELWARLRPALLEAWSLGSAAVDIYLDALVSKFLGWAKDRATVTRADLDRVRIGVGEALARESQFQAYGRGLVGRISWNPDRAIEDFFAGKGTRPGHIGAGLDVARPVWLNRIGEAISASKVCVLRSSSGQGKSTLMYRYAHDHWPGDETFTLHIAQALEEVEAVRSYLQVRADVGLPTYLLIDDAGYRTQLWPEVAQACLALGIPVLVTARNEDWHRFARQSAIGYEIIDPYPDLGEARQIFNAFKVAGRVHPSVDSPEWAYERIGEPHLLIEYVYLLTYGTMLEDRLREQLRQFSELGEDPAKIEFIRRVALAGVLGAPVRARELIHDLPLRGDPQQILSSLDAEYLILEGGIIRGLHWVRSDHLAAILHDGYPNPADTALAVLAAIPSSYVTPFVANALCRGDLNRERFLEGLAVRAVTSDISTMLTYLEGLFEAGERRYAEANRALYDEVFESDGGDVLLLLGIELQPVIKTQALKNLAEAMGERSDRLNALLEKATGSIAVPRGLDYCADFLRRVAPKIDVAHLSRDLGPTGRLLDWCYLTVVHLPAWEMARDSLLEDNAMLQLPSEEFCAFAQGLYRYDEPAYRGWLSAHRGEILGYLTLHTDSLSLDLSEDVVTVEFIADGVGPESGNSQAVSRLNALRSALPFVARYASRGNWLLPFGLTPSVDDTRKDIPAENLPLRSDVAKNVVWHHVAESPYMPDSYFRFEEAWYALRTDALIFVESLVKGLPRVMAGKPSNVQHTWGQGDLLIRLEKRLNKAPPLPPQAPDTLKDLFKDLSKESATSWRRDFCVFFQQFLGYLKDVTDKRIGRLMVHNFRDAARSIPAMHEGFARLGDTAPDYLAMHTLNAREASIYPQLVDLLEIWVLDPPATPQRDITHYIRVRRDRTADERIRRIEELVSPLRKGGEEVQVGGRTHFEYPSRHVALTFSVSDPCHPEDALVPVLKALASDTEVADYYWAIPTYRSVRFTPGAYRFTSLQLYAVQQSSVPNWESFVPCDVPSEILRILPNLPYRPLCGSEVRAAVLGLVAAWEHLAQYRRIVHTLDLSTDAYGREIARRHRERLSITERELLSAVRATLQRVEEDLGHLSGDPSYEAVSAFLLGYTQDPDKYNRDRSDSLGAAMDDLVRRAGVTL